MDKKTKNALKKALRVAGEFINAAVDIDGATPSNVPVGARYRRVFCDGEFTEWTLCDVAEANLRSRDKSMTGDIQIEYLGVMSEEKASIETRMSEQGIIDKANLLARDISLLQGYRAREGYCFYTSIHPRAKIAWECACLAFDSLLQTDVKNALDEIE